MVNRERRDWSHFALLLVDVQQSFWPVQGRPDFPDFPANVARLLALCRSEGLEVIHVRSRFKPDKSDWMLMYRLRVPVSSSPMRSRAGGRKAGALCRQRTWGACCLQADLRCPAYAGTGSLSARE